jgi:hypothetical protein
VITKPYLILAFAIAFTVFILVPPFLGQPFPAYSSIHWADVFDLFTPLVLIPLYWLLFTDSGRINRGLTLAIWFLIFSALWVLGQGMHLSANSINNLLGAGSTEVNELVHFYDEVLSHYLWHAGIIALSGLLILVSTGGAEAGRVRWAIVIPSALLYGLTYFLAVIEGGTLPIGLTSAILIVAAVLVFRRQQLRSLNLVTFFFAAHVIAIAFFLGWYAYWGSFPQPCDVLPLC